MKNDRVVRYSLILMAMGSMACGAGPARRGPLVLYPTPPEIPRLQFLTSITTSRDIGDAPSVLERIAGAEEGTTEAIAQPYGLAVGLGKLYVCDPLIQGLVVVDLEGRDFEFFQPRGPGALQRPGNAAVDQDGVLYVADAARMDVAIYDAGGEYLGNIDLPDENRPGDVFVSQGRIWVTDMTARQVRVYDRETRAFLRNFPRPGAPDEERLSSPANLFVTGEAVYVSDVIRSRINVYSLDGEYLRTIGSHGRGLGQFGRAKGVAVDREGRLYGVDAEFAHVQIFDREGRLLLFFGGYGDGPGQMIMPAKAVIDYANVQWFERYVDSRFELQYLVFITNQFGPNKINVYGFVGPPEVTGTDNQ